MFDLVACGFVHGAPGAASVVRDDDSSAKFERPTLSF